MNIKLLLTALVIFSGTFGCHAQEQQVIKLWPGTVPGETEAKHPARVRADSSGGVIRITDITDPRIKIFQPKNENDKHIGIIVAPGGGYRYLTINKEGSEVADWLNKLGYTAFVLRYRVPHKEAGALQDAQRAIRLIRYHANKFKINPDKIGFIGFSAGGSLGARLSTEYNQSLYPSIGPADSVSARPDFTLLIYPAYLNRGPNKSLTPELTIDSKTPPMFIFQTKDDHYLSSKVMTQALKKEGIPVEYHLFPKGGHGYGLRKGNPAAEAWPPLAKIWLEKIVKKLNMDVFLLIGQSNMAGRAPIKKSQQDTLQQVFLFNDSSFVPAVNPLNQYSTVRKPISWQKLNPGYAFGKTLAIHLHQKIGLVINARGGTKIEWWEKGYHGNNDFNLYEKALKAIKEAQKHGILKAILWHQGESDPHLSKEAYLSKLKKLVSDLRQDLGTDVYFLAGELGRWRSSAKTVNQAISEIPQKINNADFIKSDELHPLKGDSTNPHFNNQSQLILGKRYALKILKHIYQMNVK